MLKLVAFAASLVATVAMAQSTTHTFAPDNNLWMEDDLNFAANMTEAQFKDIIAKGKSVYDKLATQNRERIVINARWTDATVNANVTRNGSTVTINMYGGLARRPEITLDGFALVLCHELGHAYGGTPYISAARKLSAEGQADFYGVGECLKVVLPLLAENGVDVQTTNYMETKCEEKYATEGQRKATCLRQMAAGQSTANLLATLMEEKLPDYETPDPKVVSRTLTSYPETVQCRLDTYNNGTLEMKRPACWFKK